MQRTWRYGEPAPFTRGTLEWWWRMPNKQGARKTREWKTQEAGLENPAPDDICGKRGTGNAAPSKVTPQVALAV